MAIQTWIVISLEVRRHDSRGTIQWINEKSQAGGWYYTSKKSMSPQSVIGVPPSVDQVL